MGERWRVFFFGWFFVAFLFKYFLCDFLCDFCVNFCAILCEFLCDFCVNFCVIFVRIFVWVHKGNACGVRRHFAGATFWGDIYGIMELWNYGIMELWNYWIFNYFVGIGLSTRSGEGGQILCSGRRAACQKQMLYGGYPFEKIGDFFAYFFSDLWNFTSPFL